MNAAAREPPDPWQLLKNLLHSQQIFPELRDAQDSVAREGLGKGLRIQAKMPGQRTGGSDTEPKKRLNNVLFE